ncbi:MAG: RNA 2',3'-cyclic phosphodiesterase [Pyrinomonadaceae bacterium]
MKRRHEELEDAGESRVTPIPGHPSGPTLNNSWRVFCAVDLSDSVRERLMQHVTRLREAVPGSGASWSQEGNIHLTLKFFGDTQRLRISDLTEATSRSVKGKTPFKIVVEQPGAFPKLEAPRVLWIGVTDESGELSVLKQHLEDECAKVAFVREERSFHPHLTIARLREPGDGRALAAAHKELGFEPSEVVVSELKVIRSELSSHGAKYTVISRHPLGS